MVLEVCAGEGVVRFPIGLSDEFLYFNWGLGLIDFIGFLVPVTTTCTGAWGVVQVLVLGHLFSNGIVFH